MLERLSKKMNEQFSALTYSGRVTSVHKTHIELQIPKAKLGAICSISKLGNKNFFEIVSLTSKGCVAMPLDSIGDIEVGDAIALERDKASVEVGWELMGKVVDSLGRPYEGSLSEKSFEEKDIYSDALNPLDRSIIDTPLDLGVKAINTCVPCGRGQRLGIFAGSGVGKSVLLGMMARYTKADVVVVALLGERGREVNEFLHRDLGEEGLRKSVVVVETADKSAIRRVRAAFTATSIAEYFREQGKHVLLLMDSLTRFAMAQREIGLSSKEMPTTKGYTPSVFSMLSQLLERAGNWGTEGSVTGLYTVLVEGEDFEDPIADSCRAILDGHIVLTRDLAYRGHFPAIDVLKSVSRVTDQILDKEKVQMQRKMKEMLNVYYQNEDAIRFGLYQRGMDLDLDRCIEMEPQINQFLKQDRTENINFDESWDALSKLAI